MERFVRGMFLILAAAGPVWAQENAATVERQVETLYAQLREVTGKESELQERARQIDQDLQPENIERSVALIGTTNAGALRDERRQQHERQKAGVEEQLTSLATSRSRLEAAIAGAEAEAVRLRAAAVAPGANDPITRPPAEKTAPTPAFPVAQKKPERQRQRKRVRRGVRRISTPSV